LGDPPAAVVPALASWHVCTDFCDFDDGDLSGFVWCTPFSEFNDKLALVSWNSSALFGSVHGDHGRQTQTFNEFKKLLVMGDIVCAQEAHGYDEDRDTLNR
jgi:hypothetical protein